MVVSHFYLPNENGEDVSNIFIIFVMFWDCMLIFWCKSTSKRSFSHHHWADGFKSCFLGILSMGMDKKCILLTHRKHFKFSCDFHIYSCWMLGRAAACSIWILLCHLTEGSSPSRRPYFYCSDDHAVNAAADLSQHLAIVSNAKYILFFLVLVSGGAYFPCPARKFTLM